LKVLPPLRISISNLQHEYESIEIDEKEKRYLSTNGRRIYKLSNPEPKGTVTIEGEYLDCGIARFLVTP
jgi:hypothetical protein